MSKIIRVHYEHQTDLRVTNTFVDFLLLPNQEKVKYVEVRNVIPEHSEIIKLFQETE